ncbi:hypothetical protein [Streptomyces sp. NPDC005876]|uniref:hypothetical protein n=1 Tax=unclassified Streptomyces TaxID=2593676 RepID=UPI0033C62438
MAAGQDGRVPVDALMAAITGEESPPGTGTEAERRSAEADVALLREQLGVIGRALAEPPAPAPARAAPVRAPRRRRRRLHVAFGALAVACAGMFVAGLGWLAAQGGTQDGAADSSGSKAEASAGKDAGSVFGSAGYLACARVVAEGTVTAADPVPGEARHRITLRVTLSHKPARSRPEITFVLDDATARLRPGDRALVGIPRHGAAADAVVTGVRAVAAERARITAALPESRTLACD